MHNPKTSLFRKTLRGLRKFIDLLEVLGVLWMKETRYSSPLPFLKRLRAWRLGFLSDSYVQYFKDGDQHHNFYLSDYQRWRHVPAINAKYGIVLADKFLFTDFFKTFSQHLPVLFFLIRKNKLVRPDFKETSWENLLDRLDKERFVILKPRSGFGGRGIFVVSRKEETFEVNKKVHSASSFIEFAKTLDNYLVTQYVQQQGYAHNIFPDSVNTLRILTFVDPQTQEARIGGIAHRFGSRTTGTVDNWTSGGISAAVDLETGAIGKCAQNPEGKDVIWLTHHPDTGAPISGQVIPNWDFIVKRVLEMANSYKLCPYIGWDVAVSQNNFWVLEANDSPDVHILQIHQPLLKSKENRLFYGFYRVINP